MEVRANGSIRVSFVYRGVRCRETLKNLKPTKANLSYAKDLLSQIRREITRGEFDYTRHFPASKLGRKLSESDSYLTLRDIRDEYAAEIKTKYAHATVRTYLQPLDSWWIPQVKLPLAEIDANTIRQELKAMHREDLAAKTINTYKTAINRILDYAVEESLLEANPALSVSVGRTVGTQKAVSNGVDPFTTDEIKTILETANGFMRRYLTFMFYTGLRPSESYALTWHDVDLVAGTVTVNKAVVHGKPKGTKTKAGDRVVQLLPSALAALKEQQKYTRFRKHGHVWENPQTHKPLRRYKEVGGRWARLLKKAEVRYRKPSQTRHTYASQLLSGGENPYFVSSQLGHETVTITQRHYARWIKQAEHEWAGQYGMEDVK